jgi:hypothetical protein
VTLITLFASAFVVTVKITFELVLRDVGANLTKLDQPIMDFLLSHPVLTAFDLNPDKPLIGVKYLLKKWAS